MFRKCMIVSKNRAKTSIKNVVTVTMSIHYSIYQLYVKLIFIDGQSKSTGPTISHFV